MTNFVLITFYTLIDFYQANIRLMPVQNPSCSCSKGDKSLLTHLVCVGIPTGINIVDIQCMSNKLLKIGASFTCTVPATLTFTFLSYPIVRVSYPIVRLSYPIVRVSYQVFSLSYRENRLSGFPFIVYQVLRLSRFPFIVHQVLRLSCESEYLGIFMNK